MVQAIRGSRRLAFHLTLRTNCSCTRNIEKSHLQSAAVLDFANMSTSAGMMIGGPDPEVMAAIERGNAVVFMDVVLGEDSNFVELGRIKLELFVKDVSVET